MTDALAPRPARQRAPLQTPGSRYFAVVAAADALPPLPDDVLLVDVLDVVDPELDVLDESDDVLAAVVLLDDDALEPPPFLFELPE